MDRCYIDGSAYSVWMDAWMDAWLVWLVGWICGTEAYFRRTSKRENKMIAHMDDIEKNLSIISQTLNVVCMDTVSILDAVDTEDKSKKPQEVILSRN